MFKRTLLLILLMALLAPLAMHAQQTLLSENFDSMSSIATSYSATDWYAYNASSTNTNNWFLFNNPSYAYSGSNSVIYSYDENYDADCYLVSAPFTVATNMTELDVSLYEMVDPSYPEIFEVFFVKASDVTTFEGVASATRYYAIASATYNNGDFEQVSGSNTNSNLAGQSVRLVVHCTSEANNDFISIDDITVTLFTTEPYILLNPSSTTVFTGFTQTLTATYGNVTGTPTITYTSSDKKTASVSGSGTTATVTGESVGTATITATMTYLGTDYTATCDVTVEDPYYCEPYFSYTNTNYGLYIKSFETEGGVANISNNTSLTAGGYADYYDSEFASIAVGETLSFTVTPGFTNSSGYAIWIDWNQDYEFSSDERVAATTTTQTTAWTGTIPIASSTPLGDYRMRVMLQYGTNPSNPCVSSTYGEAEDYKLTVLAVSTCDYPTALQYSEVDKRSVKLSWTENGTATSWQVCINGDETHLVTANTNTNYLLEDLEPETDYTVKVRAYCDISSQSYWSNEVSFTTEVACPAPTGMHAENVTAYTADVKWTSDAGNYEFRYGSSAAASELLLYDNGAFGTNIGAGGSFYWATMFPAGSYTGNYLSKVTNYDIDVMTGNLLIYNDGVTAPAHLVATKAIEFTGAGEFVDFTFEQLVELDPSKNLWIVFQQIDGANYPAAAATDPGDINARWASLDGVNWDDLANLGVSGYGWMIRANVETISLSGTIHSCTANTYPLTGLTPETTYAAQVRSVCGGEDGESEWATTLFTTPAACTAPEGLAISGAVGSRDATFTWTAEDGATFQYCTVANPTPSYTPSDSEFADETSQNTVTFTHYFTPDTDYVFYLRKKCGTKEFSDIVSIAFHTNVACEAPTALTVSNIGAKTADVSWTGSAGDYDVRYGVYPDASTAQEWLTYNVTKSSSYGSSTASTRTWGVKYLGNEVNGNCLTKVQVYEAVGSSGAYNTGGTTIINVYSGGDNAPGELLYTETVPMAVTSSGLVTITLASPVMIPSGKSLWITLTETGTYILSCGACTDNNNRWYYSGGTWIAWATGVNNNLGWIINGYMETLDLDAIAWNNDATTENNYPIKGLSPETPYIVQVRSNCGGEDGESVWVGKYFETTSSCATPTGLAATNVTYNSATLNWTGGSGNYDVQYGLYEEGSTAQKWLTYNVTQSKNYGSSTASTRTRGVKYLASEITGNVLTAIEFWDNLTYNQGGNIIVNIYTGGDSAPGALLYTETIVPTTTGLQTVRLAEPVSIPSGENLWITFTEYGTYTLFSGPCTDDNNRWVLNGSTWITWATGQSNELGWIINGYMETVDLDQINWHTATCTETTYPLTGLNPDSYYIAQVRSDCSGGQYSEWGSTYFTTEAGLDFITDGNWNDGSNWCLGVVPADGSSVTIKANAIIPKGYDAITDVITLDGGSITIKDGGQLHSNNAVQATVEKEITGYSSDKDHYYFIANPLSSNVNPATSGIASGTFDLYSFNGTLEGEEWRNYEASAFNLTGSNGYLYANADDITLQFTGSVRKQNTSSYNYISTNKLKYDATTAFGTWNLVGNLFPHNAYVYVGALVNNSLSFADEMYYYKMNDTGNEIVSTNGNEMIKPCEGVFVQSSAADQYAFFASVKRKRDSKGLNLNLTASGKLVDRATLSFDECNGLEKFQLNPNHTKVYVPVNGKDYAVTHAEEQGEMPVNFKAEKSGTYTLSFTTDNVEFNYLHLIDNITGNEVDLLATPSYTFDARYTDYAARFRLVFSKGSANGDDNFGFISNGQLILTGLTGGETLQVIDALGRLIVSTNANNHVSTENMAAGVYVLRLINGNDVKTQKIVVR